MSTLEGFIMPSVSRLIMFAVSLVSGQAINTKSLSLNRVGRSTNSASARSASGLRERPVYRQRAISKPCKRFRIV
uniref:Putative secreted protein n=1 Tax=Anopheles darlingi TaxID=43151 RepID=A0A2M4D2J3_ANODA